MKAFREVISVDPQLSFYVGRFGADEECKIKYWHFHPEYEIVFINKGSGTREIGNHSSTYEDGELILLGPNIPHLAYRVERLPDNYEVVIQLRQDLIDQLLGFAETSKIKSLLATSKQGLAFGKKTKELVRDYVQDILETDSRRIYCLFRILHDMAEATDLEILKSEPLHINRPNADINRVEKIYDYISKHYQETISLDQLASEVGLTKNSLCRFFKQVTGKTIVSFLHQYRISHAKEMLVESNQSIGEIAYNSGFNDIGFFNRKFKELTQKTPMLFREKGRRPISY